MAVWSFPTCCPPPPVVHLWMAVTFLLRWFFFTVEQRIISDNQTFFTRKFQLEENPCLLFHKCRIWWLSSSGNPRQLEVVLPRSPIFTKLPPWPVGSVLPVLPQDDKEKLNFIKWVTGGLFSSLFGTKQIKEQHYGKCIKQPKELVSWSPKPGCLCSLRPRLKCWHPSLRKVQVCQSWAMGCRRQQWGGAAPWQPARAGQC